jgi:CHAD domain-containing protein
LNYVERFLGRKSSGYREAWTAVQQFLLVRRSEQQRRATRKLNKINSTVFYENLSQLLRESDIQNEAAGRHLDYGVGPSDSPVPKGSGITANLVAALESAWSRFEAQLECSRRSSGPDVIHGARIATKRLRYLIEVYHDLGVPGSAEMLVWLRQLQKHLGDWHDLKVLEESMIEMLARPEFLREHLTLAISIEKLILRNRVATARFETRYATDFRDSQELRRLRDWVSYGMGSPSTAPVSA